MLIGSNTLPVKRNISVLLHNQKSLKSYLAATNLLLDISETVHPAR